MLPRGDCCPYRLTLSRRILLPSPEVIQGGLRPTSYPLPTRAASGKLRTREQNSTFFPRCTIYYILLQTQVDWSPRITTSEFNISVRFYLEVNSLMRLCLLCIYAETIGTVYNIFKFLTPHNAEMNDCDPIILHLFHSFNSLCIKTMSRDL